MLKENAAMSCRILKKAGKPRHGPIHNKYRQDKLPARETMSFSNDLHYALLQQSGQDFYEIWNSKFDRKVIHPLSVG